jgi:hypothetical protein
MTADAYLVRVTDLDEITYSTWSAFIVGATGASGNLHAFTASSALVVGRRMLGGVSGRDDLGNAFVYAIGGDSGATGAVLENVTMAPAQCTAPHAVWVTPDQSKAFVICEGDHLTPGTVAVVNLAVADPFVETVVPVGLFPDDAIFLGPQ